VGSRKVFRFPIVLTDHIFDKVRAIDLTLAGFEELLDSGEIIEERTLSSEAVKELVLLLEWTWPLHIVVIVDVGALHTASPPSGIGPRMQLLAVPPRSSSACNHGYPTVGTRQQ